MNIAIDISPLRTGHKVRGIGFYVHHLKDALLRCYPKNIYYDFVRVSDLPKKVDIVHYPYFDPFFLTLPFIKWHKTVVTIHDLTPLVFPKAFPSGIRGKIKWYIQKFLLRQVDAIITDSHCSKNDILHFTGISPSKVHVVYLAAGEEFKILSKEKKERTLKKYNLSKPFLLYVGDATWNKNLPRLLQAIEDMDVSLVMVGKSLASMPENQENIWNRDLLLTQSLIQKNPKVVSVGFISAEELVCLYNSASALIMPSLYEGFGLPILEAMSSGCPVITSKEGSIPEVAGSAAYYIDAYNETSLRNGITKVMSDKQLQKELQQKGFEQAKKFSWDNVAKETMGVYEYIIG